MHANEVRVVIRDDCIVGTRMTLAAAPQCMQGEVAAGLLGCGSVILGASETAGRFLSEIVTGSLVSGKGLLSAVVGALQRRVAESRPIPGYGHALHKDRVWCKQLQDPELSAWFRPYYLGTWSDPVILARLGIPFEEMSGPVLALGGGADQM